MPAHASQLYAKNLENLLGLMIAEEGELELDFDDEIVAGACITHDGEIKNEQRACRKDELMDLVTEITIFVLAAFVGFEVISKVPTTLHTPLMSQTNAIHGIVMLGGLIVVGYADDALELTSSAFDRDRLRRDQHRRRLHGHRPDARHVQPQEAETEAGRRGREADRRLIADRSPRAGRRRRHGCSTSSPSRSSSSGSSRAPTRPPPSAAT